MNTISLVTKDARMQEKQPEDPVNMFWRLARYRKYFFGDEETEFFPELEEAYALYFCQY